MTYFCLRKEHAYTPLPTAKWVFTSKNIKSEASLLGTFKRN